MSDQKVTITWSVIAIITLLIILGISLFKDKIWKDDSREFLFQMDSLHIVTKDEKTLFELEKQNNKDIVVLKKILDD